MGCNIKANDSLFSVGKNVYINETVSGSHFTVKNKICFFLLLFFIFHF